MPVPQHQHLWPHRTQVAFNSARTSRLDAVAVDTGLCARTGDRTTIRIRIARSSCARSASDGAWLCAAERVALAIDTANKPGKTSRASRVWNPTGADAWLAPVPVRHRQRRGRLRTVDGDTRTLGPGGIGACDCP